MKNESDRVSIGKRNRDKILSELLENPLTFSQLKKKILNPKTQEEISAKTLSQHLAILQKEGLLKREIQGKYIVYIANKPKTILELRNEFLKGFIDLLSIYGGGLSHKTADLTQQYLNSISESIKNPEEEAKTTKAFSRRIKINGFKGEIKVPISKPYEKIEFKEEEKPKPLKPYSSQRKRRKV